MRATSSSRYAVHSVPGHLAEDAIALRDTCFRADTRDAFDDRATHILIQDRASGALVCTFRVAIWRGDDVADSYTAQFYGLENMTLPGGPMLELGRFCVHPDWRDPDILRLAWAELTALVDRENVQLLFGCASFAGTDTALYGDAFAVLKARHLAPKSWMPRLKAPQVFRFAARLRRKPKLRQGMSLMPPLLRSYLTMGGRVSDHAVIDRQMNTLHVFCGIETGAIPPARKKLLRALI